MPTPEGVDPILDLMRDSDLPITLETYIELNCIDCKPGPEFMASLPVEFKPELLGGDIPDDEYEEPDVDLTEDDEEFEEYYGMDAQQIHDAESAKHEFKLNKEGVQDLINTANSHQRLASPKWGGLVESVMKRHGFSREKAIEEIEKWGG